MKKFLFTPHILALALMFFSLSSNATDSANDYYKWVNDYGGKYSVCKHVQTFPNGITQEFPVENQNSGKCTAAMPWGTKFIWITAPDARVPDATSGSVCFRVNGDSSTSFMQWILKGDEDGNCARAMPQTHYVITQMGECRRVDNETNGKKFNLLLSAQQYKDRSECKTAERLPVHGTPVPLCEWVGNGPNSRGAKIIDIDHKNPSCAKYTDKLPLKMCFGQAICNVDRLARVDLNKTLSPEDSKRLDQVMTENPSVSAAFVSVALCETSADDACPTADECVFKKAKPGNPNSLLKGEQYSNASTTLPARLKSLDKADISAYNRSHVFISTQSIDGLKAAQSDQEVVGMLYEVSQLRKTDKAKVLVGDQAAFCLKQSSGSIHQCEADSCITEEATGAKEISYTQPANHGSSDEKTLKAH